jgi:hypothetical protein
MKKIYNILLISLVVIGFSCEDPDLDPLQFDKVAKGTIVALRGAALNKVYVQGKPISEIFPRITTGTEKFTYEAEILATDPSTVASLDIFVVKRVGTTLERKMLKNVPASAFAKGAYANPSATISLTITEVLTALGLTATYPLPQSVIDALLTTYKFGVGIETNINLTDGTKVLASEIVAAGLFQSNQFYPAMVLTWAVTDYCSYNAADWSGDFTATELSEFSGIYGPYTVTFASIGGNKFTTNNFYDSGWPITFEFTPSVDVPTQTVTASGTVTTGSGNVYAYSGSGTYNQCTGVASVNLNISKNGTPGYDILVWKIEK